ncbi:MAG: 30S ribosomal protein S8 [Ignavibacterium sp.]|nr:30S ribosomal protein S8 [Ignavibacterium sp.]MCX7612440.1 30S ribosomal protein S8 [Ignavibacterium sp.]MDW8374558.1 30S ribosomal protein S8 [Ignavibacteriales bacterium]
MPVTDPIADFLTRLRNACKAKHLRVEVPASKMKLKICEILKNESFIHDYTVIEDNKQNIIRIHLKYRNGMSAISGLKRVSKPGLRIYKGVEELPRVLNGLGIAIVSTSKGILTDKQARAASVGGEVICYIW